MWRVEPGCETHDTSASEPTLRAGKPRSETGCSVVGQPLSAFGWHFQETVTADNRGRSNAMAVVAQPDSTRCRSKSNQGDVGQRYGALWCSDAASFRAAHPRASRQSVDARLEPTRGIRVWRRCPSPIQDPGSRESQQGTERTEPSCGKLLISMRPGRIIRMRTLHRSGLPGRNRRLAPCSGHGCSRGLALCEEVVGRGAPNSISRR